MWCREGEYSAALCMEVKTPWYVGNVDNIVEAMAADTGYANVKSGVEQVYGYMSVRQILGAFHCPWKMDSNFFFLLCACRGTITSMVS